TIVSFIPLLLILRRDRRVVTLSIFLLGATILWFESVQYARYLLPALTAAAALVGAAIAVVLDRVSLPVRGLTAIALAGFFISGLAALGASEWNVPGGVPWALAFGRQSADEYLMTTS